MKVPNAHAAVIEDSKLREYLLSLAHPVGRYKARFFRGLGYTREDAGQLAADLRGILGNEVDETIETEFGIKYVVPGQLVAPGGSATEIVTIWIILIGEEAPTLVTAYPGGSDED